MAVDLAPVAAAVGAAIVDEDRLAPKLDIRDPQVSRLGRHIGQILRRTPLFVRGNDLVTVDEETGELRMMEPARFISWAEDWVSFGRWEGDTFKPKSITKELATNILKSDQFWKELRPLRGVHDVRLPSWADAKRTAIRLLPSGYDDETGIFTAPALDYQTDLLPDDGRKFLLETYRDFPFAEGGPLEKNRSFAVLMAAHFAAFARLLLVDCLRPAFVFLANQAGSGKTLLARMALAPVFGPVAIEGFPKDETERHKQLTTLAAEARAYAFYDNVKGHLSSAMLEGFLTSPQWTGRILGHSATITAPNLATVFVSGNQLSLSADLKRRCLVCDLFEAGEATEREFANPITDAWPSESETRARFLAALWSLLEYWTSSKCKRAETGLLPTFETFSGIVGGLVTFCQFANPLAAPEAMMDEQEQAWRLLLQAMAEKVETGRTKEFTSDECLDMARDELEILDLLTLGAKDERKAFGQRIKSWLGRRMADRQGREFQFGHRRGALGVRYPVQVFGKEGETGNRPIAR